MGKNKAIDSVIQKLEKRFGEPVVMKMSDSKSDVETISSGRPDLDAALGGGYGVGKIVEIFAESGCGKTGLALEAIKVVQDSGGIAAIVDAEHALNTEYCELIGVNIDDIYISQPSYGEQAIEAIRGLISTGEIELIVVDSVAALTPKAEIEGESGETKMGLHARLMSQAMKMITGAASEVGCTVIFINQMRSTIAMYGPATTTTGGKALKFYATQRLEIKSKGQIKEGDEVIGFKQHIKVVKNKIAPPFKQVQNDIVYGKGIDHLTSLIEACIFNEILTRAGSWYKYDGTNIAKGMKGLRAALEDNPDLVDVLKEQLNKS